MPELPYKPPFHEKVYFNHLLITYARSASLCAAVEGVRRKGGDRVVLRQPAVTRRFASVRR